MKSTSSLVEMGPCLTLWYRTSKPWFFSPYRGWKWRLRKGMQKTSRLPSNRGVNLRIQLAEVLLLGCMNWFRPEPIGLLHFLLGHHWFMRLKVA